MIFVRAQATLSPHNELLLDVVRNIVLIFSISATLGRPVLAAQVGKEAARRYSADLSEFLLCAIARIKKQLA